MFDMPGKIDKARQQTVECEYGRKMASAVCRPLSANKGCCLSSAYRQSAQRGLTLVEVMIAFLVLLITSLALMQTALVSIESNMKNVLRDEAASIAEQRISDMKSMPFASISSDASRPADINVNNCPAAFITSFGSNGFLVQRNLKNVANFNFCTNSTVTSPGGSINTKQIVITVGWTWKGVAYTHTSNCIVGQ